MPSPPVAPPGERARRAGLLDRELDPAVDRALEELAFHCKELRMLGSYPQERVRG